MDNYVRRQPIEIILNSKRGTKIGEIDGYKFFDLENEVVARKDEKILLHLKKGFIPFSFYCISEGQKNTYLDVKETDSTGATNTYAINVPAGNYNVSGLINELQTSMEATSTFNYKYSITYNEYTSKITFSLKSGTNLANTKLLFNTGTNKNQSLVRVLGFSDDADKTIDISTTAISNNVVDLADGLDSLHIKSNLVGDNIQSTTNSINGGELLIVPVDLSPNSILYFDEGNNPFKHQLSTTSFKRIIIRFSDNYDNVVDFNGIPYSLILIAEFIPDPNAMMIAKNQQLELKKRNNMVTRENEMKNLYKFMLDKGISKKK
jgi:hypothetical protein